MKKCLLPAMLAAGVLFAATVRTDYDHKADFGRYHTYSWIAVRAGDSLWTDRIKAAVDNQLAARGWTRVGSGGDATVAALGRITERDTLQSFYDAFPGWGWMGWGGTGTVSTEVIPEQVGNLTVDLFDGQTKHLIWRGAAAEILSSKPEKNEKKLENAIGEMFAHFPKG